MSNIVTMLNLVNDAIFVSLVNTTLQMTLIIPLIALVIFLFRIKSPTTRYSLWLFVIFGIIALPLLTPFIPQLNFAKFYNQRATGDGLSDLMRLRMGSGGVGELSEGGVSDSAIGATKATVNKEADVSLMNPVSVAYFLWCAGALFMFWITLDAYRKLRRLRINSPDVKDSMALEMLSRLKQKIKVGRSVALKASSEIYTPVSLGVFSHTIILPDGVIPVGYEISPPLVGGAGGGVELEMIITHELAHIKRCDYLINFLQNMLRVIFFFHPLFHFASRNLTREREHICDDWVVDMTNQRGRYAECIIGLLEKALYKPVNVPVAIAMAERKRDIPRRIDMIMDKKRKITAKVSKKALVAMLLIGCLSLPVIGGIALVHFAGARSASNEGRIVFAKDGGIWVMDADGKNEKQLTTGIDYGPAWSPDGKQVAFFRWNDEINGIYIMKADGSNIKELTKVGVAVSSTGLTWSPSGKQIAFSKIDWEQDKFKSSSICVINLDGANLRQLIDSKDSQIHNVDWSPDGNKIAFYMTPDKGGIGGVWVMDADGNNAKMIYDWGWGPAWSPDGKQIAFMSTRAGQGFTADIYVMNSDGTNVKTLTEPSPAGDYNPDWSPDGTRIIFMSDQHNPGSEQYDFYIMAADGSNIQRLTNTPENEYDPDWTAYSYGVSLLAS